MKVFETTVKFYTDHNFAHGNDQTFDPDIVKSVVGAALLQVDNPDEAIVAEFSGVKEYTVRNIESSDAAKLLQEQKTAANGAFIKGLALERFLDSISTWYGMSDLAPWIEVDELIVEGISTHYPRILVTVSQTGSGETEEEAADDSRFTVKLLKRPSFAAERAGTDLTAAEARVLVVGMARTVLE